MLYKLIFSILLLTISISVQSQDREMYSKYYLQDGSIYIGKMVDVNPNVDIRIQLIDNTIIRIPNGTIKKIVRMDKVVKEKKEYFYEFIEKGFYNVNYVSILGGNSSETHPGLGFGLSSCFGYMINKHLGFGIGLGFDKFDLIKLHGEYPFYDVVPIESAMTGIIPIFIETRGYLFGEKTAYYYSINTGYGFANANKELNVAEANGGLMIYPAIGIRFGGHKHFNFCIDLGLKYQKFDFSIPNYFESGTDHYYINYKRFIFRVGMQI